MAENPRTASSRLVVFAPDAENDQVVIYTDTAEQWGTAQADKYLNFLLDTAQSLANTPKLAPIVPDTEKTRVFIARWKNAREGHRIFFEETPEGINVLRILHTKRNWPNLIG